MTQPESAMHKLTPIKRRRFLIIPGSILPSLRRAPRLAYPNDGCGCDRIRRFGFAAFENIEVVYLLGA